MYGQIKRKTNIGDTIELGLKSASELGACSRSDVKSILSKLEKFGFLTCIQRGKQGQPDVSIFNLSAGGLVMTTILGLKIIERSLHLNKFVIPEWVYGKLSSWVEYPK